MFFQTESKAQTWRAVAQFSDRPELLIYLGRSSTQVRGSYAEAFADVLDDEEQAACTTVVLQRWNGTPDSGKWLVQANLNVPASALLLRVA
jgi:hypothetical protein